MKQNFICKAASMLVFLGMSFNIQAGRSDELAKHRQLVDSAIEDMKSTIATCRAQYDKLHLLSDHKSCSKIIKLRLECRDRIDKDLTIIAMNRDNIRAVYKQHHKDKCEDNDIE